MLRLTGISKSFGGVVALRNVSLELARAQVHALIGENGAGKSTLVKIITGAITPDEGSVEIDGHAVRKYAPAAARALGVAAIYQQPALLADLTVMENLALRLERGGLWRWISWRDRRRRARELLQRVGAAAGVEPEALAGGLSMPQQQLVEIAAALGSGANYLIFDEPTASLGQREIENLFALIGELRKGGVGMVYISPRLEELPRIADRVTVLRDGRQVATLAMEAAARGELVRLMVGRPVDAVYPKVAATAGEVVLEMRGLGRRKSGVKDVNLSVRGGEILGIAGLVGAGRTELARILFGLTPADRGRILLRGKAVRIRSPRRAIELGIAYVPEDRRRHGVIGEFSVAANTTLAILRQVSRFGLIRRGEEEEIAAGWARRVMTRMPSLRTPVEELSGGNQQKVALSRWLAARPAVLILDEPTQGVDVSAKVEIHRLMSEMAARGMAVVMISSELPEVLGVSDRIAVMARGTVIGVLDAAQATQEGVLEMALGGGQGQAGAA
ncbi:MAG: sugar ABC transporter ATP-binding protein [Tepidisphaeraceae bacterium]|jgi:rhamnose transport system ATP-binding protein